MVSVALLSKVSPSPLADELERWGYQVLEALSLSEILHLCEHQRPAAVSVAAGVEVYGWNEVAQHHKVIEQRGSCTTEQIVEMLTVMFGHAALKQ